MHRFFRLCLLVAVLSGCATQRSSLNLPDMPTWEQRQEVLENLSHWEFRGRIAVKDGDEGFNGKIRWVQDGDAFLATLGGPLGIGTVTIEGDGEKVVFTDKDNVETVLLNAEKELLIRYGWTIPIARLRFWVRGIPDPIVPAETEMDEAGRLVRLEQSDWTVEFSQYRGQTGREMPRKLTASTANSRVRLVIGRWSFFDR